MNSNDISSVLAVLLSYLHGLIDAREMVSKIDDFVANDGAATMETEVSEQFSELHRAMALCVWDGQTHREARTVYILEPELRARVSDFVAAWGQSLASKL